MTSDDDGAYQSAMNILFCGGIAGVVTWGSVFPLDMIKTRLQAQTIGDHGRVTETQALLGRRSLSSFQVAKDAYQAEGVKAFYRGLGVCSVRAFIVNAVQVCSLPV
jgi:solute carrier family 25 carnitine/acylcarnitine transporter 20/29